MFLRRHFRAAPRLAAALSLAGSIGVLSCGDPPVTPSTPAIVAHSGTAAASAWGNVILCKEGPAGTYTFDWTALTNPVTTGTTSVTVPVDNQHTCATIWHGLDSGFVDVTVQQRPAPETRLTGVRYYSEPDYYRTIVPATDGFNTTATVTARQDYNWYLTFLDEAYCDDQAATNYGAAAACEYPPEVTPCPAGSFTWTLNGNGDLQIVYDQFPAPNDNSYGANAVGWPYAHRFGDLVGGDHAGIELRDASGVVRLSFNVDYLSPGPDAPSGFKSLGVSGGEGHMIVGSADGISATTSLDRNLNGVNIPGLFNAAHVQQFGSVNVLVSSPPTDPSHTTYVVSDPALTHWDFHNTYFVTISAAKLAALGFDAATWQVRPSREQIHNSPAKPCPPSIDALSVTRSEVKDRQVKVTIRNSGRTNVYLTALSLTWPAATNGRLMQVRLDGEVIYDNPNIAGGTANLTLAQLTRDPHKRRIEHRSNDVYTLVFERNADRNLAHYSGSVSFGAVVFPVLPP